jgi:hypothetical protein
MKFVCASVLASLVVVVTSSVRADETKDACLVGYEQSQVARKSGDLATARQQLRVCARAACPALVRNDCVTWLEQVESSFPSIVLHAERDGADVTAVRVVLDGKSIASRLDGKGFEIPPGEHTFRFELEGAPPVTQTVLVREGEKDRPVEIHFASAHSKSAPKSDEVPQSFRPTPTGVYVLGGLGLAGLGTFAVLAATGKGKESSLRSSCAPSCSDSSVSSLQTQFLIGDLGLGVGIASSAAALLWYALRPSTPEGAHVDIDASAHGASFWWTHSF